MTPSAAMGVHHIPGAHIQAARQQARAGILVVRIPAVLAVHLPLKGTIEGTSKAASQVDTAAPRKFVLRLNLYFKKLMTPSAAMGVHHIPGAHILAVRQQARAGILVARIPAVLAVHLPLKGTIEETSKAASQVDTVALRKFVLRLNLYFKKLMTPSAAMGVHRIPVAHILAVHQQARAGILVAHIPAVPAVHLPLKGTIEETSKAASQMDTVVPRKFLLRLNLDFQKLTTASAAMGVHQ
jgi:hypothetical protein